MKIIATSGVARSGKDTIANGLAAVIKDMNPSLKVMRTAFADELKLDLSNFLIEKFNIDPFTAEGFDKEIIRPILVGYGQSKRIETKGRYWIDKVQDKANIENPDILIISDLRFAQEEDDELSWLKESGGKLIHVSRYHIKNGKKEFVKPPNADEKANDPILKKNADFLVSWKDAADDQELKLMTKEYCEKFYYQNISLFQ